MVSKDFIILPLKSIDYARNMLCRNVRSYLKMVNSENLAADHFRTKSSVLELEIVFV